MGDDGVTQRTNVAALGAREQDFWIAGEAAAGPSVWLDTQRSGPGAPDPFHLYYVGCQED